ncbi:MAG: methyltransferase [Succinivibrio sp.]|nr:methyltransferase [Succinivibrio sp.]
MANDAIFKLLERNEDIFKDREILLTGDLLDNALLTFIKYAKKAVVVADNYVTFKAMAAMVGKSVSDECEQCIEYKHLKLIFGTDEYAKKQFDSVDTLVVVLSKNKNQTVRILNSYKEKLKAGSFIYTAGSNDGGAKSADTLLKVAGPVRKVDLARKCTLFKAIYENDFSTYKKPENINVEVGSFEAQLKQDPNVFSTGKLDNGTALLLESMVDVIPQGNALDLACGCGVVGIFLSKLGFKNVTSTDVSACALSLTKENAKLNNIDDLYTVPSDMLSNLKEYSLIAVNPPFHIGLDTSTAPTVSMILDAPKHLKEGGAMYLVANAHLGYEKIINDAFGNVQIMKRTPSFIVYKALKNTK